MTETNNLSFVAFISELRALWGRGNTEGTSHWQSVRTCLGKLIKDIELQEASSNWPGKRGEELILYHDADYGFFVGGLVRPHQHDARPHDHAHTWTAYGVLFGREKTTLFERTDDMSIPGTAIIEVSEEYDAPQGHVDLVPPWKIHAESNYGNRSVAITVRTEKPGGYAQNLFFPETNKTDRSHRGLKLIPFSLIG